MTSKSGHTKTPWKLILPEPEKTYDENNPEHSLIAIMMDSRLKNNDVYSTAHEIVLAEGVAPGECPEQEANAEFIVKACNNHDELLKSLKALLKHFESLNYSCYGDEVIKAKQAIVKAEENQ